VEAILAHTILFHALILLYFRVYVFFAKFTFSDNPADSFVERVSTGHKWLMMLSVLAMAPVGFVLKRPDMKNLASISGESPNKPVPRSRGFRGHHA